MIRAGVLVFLGLMVAAPAQAGVCQRWGQPETVGQLDPQQIRESSGIAVSRKFAGRLYHHNDSGAGPIFYVTDGAGGNMKVVTLDIPRPVDVEDMAIGRCAGARTCLYFGDVGDNNSVRDGGSFTIVAEKADYAPTETPLRVVRIRYPDGELNAEGFAIHPNGDLYLVSKVDQGTQPTRIFRLTRKQLAVSDGSVQTLTEVGRIDLAPLMRAGSAKTIEDRSMRVTGFDIARNGRRAVLLTYNGALEIGFNLARPLPPQATWRLGRDFGYIETANLLQAEAITYTADGRSILYDSERSTSPDPAPIMRQTCEAR